MTAGASDARAHLDAVRATAVRPQLSHAEAVACQFRLVDAMQEVMGSDVVFEEDYGQARDTATGAFTARGGPEATRRVERTLAAFFDTEDATLVHGAGTGSIRAMLGAAVRPGRRVVRHAAPPYKTTVAALDELAVEETELDFNDVDALGDALRQAPPAAVYVQAVPQRLGDRYDPEAVVAVARAAVPDALILVDDCYAALRAPRIGAQYGADASAFSLFKLLARANVGCVTGRAPVIDRLRARLSSAGCQVQGPDAMDALRSLVHAPVALAIHGEVVAAVAAEAQRMIREGEAPALLGAVDAQPGSRGVVLVFRRPVARAFLAAAWRNGSPSRSVGEEARHDVLPLFTTMPGTWQRAAPTLGDHAVRVNPLRGGPEAVLRVLRAALADPAFARAGAAADQAPRSSRPATAPASSARSAS
ncbi:MAG: hypothetical protein QOF04_3648 [Solirubrobacteraceae bacterium]|jgi:hypothetical protein|nr:hypothetical protein [Solirubrobacteraceae bacterium]